MELSVGPLPEARGDRTLLGSLWSNLLSNALKYSRGCEKRRVRVTGRREAGACLYEVADNGHGFGFEGRYDLPELTRMNLGPVTLKERVASLGGAFTLESRTSGAVLEITLPAAGATA